MDMVGHHVSIAKQAARAELEADAAACISTPDLPDARAAYDRIPRQQLVGVLQAAADVEAFTPPWNTSTVVVAGDRWARLEAAVLACLDRVPMLASDDDDRESSAQVA